MSIVVEQIMDKYTPFVGKSEFDNSQLKNRLIHNQQQFNNFSHQHNVFIHINSKNKSKVIMNICIWIITEYKKLNLNKSYAMLNYIIRSKHIMNKLKACYDGYNIKFYENFYKDIFKLLTKDVILKYLVGELKKDDKILKVFFKKLYSLFEDTKLNFKFKVSIVEKYFKVNFKHDDSHRFSNITIINYLKELEPLLITDKEKNIFKYQYLTEFLNYSKNIQFINYEIIHKNFLDILKVNNSFENSAVKELFNCISQLKYTNFFNNKLFIVFGSIIKHNDSNYKHICNLKVEPILKILNKDFLEYITVVFHEELLKNKKDENNINDYVSYLKVILKILNEDYIKNMLDLVENKVSLFENIYIDYLKNRIMFSNNFKFEDEENIYLKLKTNKDLNLNKLDAVFNDIKISVTCYNKLSKTKLSLNDDTYDSLLKNKFNEIKKIVKPYYFSKYTSTNSELFKINETGNGDLDLALKIAKNNLKQRLMHDTKIEVSETTGIYDFNAQINDKVIRIKANLREFYFLNNFFKFDSSITISQILEKEKKLKYKNNELQKTLYKLIIANIIVMINLYEFKLNNKISVDEIDLFELSYDFKIDNNSEKLKEWSIDDKVFCAQAHITKIIKPYSDIRVKLKTIYTQTVFNVKKYFELTESVFINALKKLVLKNLCSVYNAKRDSEMLNSVDSIKISDCEGILVKYIV